MRGMPSSEYSFVLAELGFAPIHTSVAGELYSRYARIAAERDAAPRASECRPEIDEAIELCSFWFGPKPPAESAIAGLGEGRYEPKIEKQEAALYKNPRHAR